MTSTNSNIKIISPFLQGIAGCFDIAAAFDDCSLPDSNFDNPILNDWQAVHFDYNNSIKIIDEELNADKKTPRK